MMNSVGAITNEMSQSLEKGRRTFSTVEVEVFPCISFVLSNKSCIFAAKSYIISYE